jgi:sec-independent protein translocase protein TatC
MSKLEEQDGLQMSFLDHLDELRSRLIYSVVAIAIAFAICFYFSGRIYNFLAGPVKEQLQKASRKQKGAIGQINFNQLNEGEVVDYCFPQETVINGARIAIGSTVPVKKVTKDNEPRLVLARPLIIGGQPIAPDTSINDILKKGESRIVYDDVTDKLTVSNLTSPFMIYMQVALYAAIAFAIPFLLYQVWAFISPGLYKHEKGYVVPVLVMSTVFFTLGATFAYKIAFPTACDFLLGWAAEGGFITLLNAEEYLNLIIMIMLGLGLVFQIPTIAYILGRIGLLTPRIMLRYWRQAMVVIAIVSAVLTPTTDYVNMLVFAAPMVALYFLSVGIVWIFGKSRRSDSEKLTTLDLLSVGIVWILGKLWRGDNERAPALVRTEFR